MNSSIEAIHKFFSLFVDLVMWPVKQAGEGISLGFASIVVGLLLLVIYGRVSNQKAISKVKASIHSSLLEAVLFRHAPVLCLRAQGFMLLGGLRYFFTAVPPILILAAPSIFLLAQLNSRFGYAPARPGEPLVVVVKAADSRHLDALSMRSDPGLEVIGPVRVPQERSAFFRVHASEAGHYRGSIGGFGGEVSLEVPVGIRSPLIEAGRYTRWWMAMLYPAQTALPAEIEEIEVLYPSKNISIFGFKANWLIHFLVISLLSGIIASKFLGIEI